VTLVTLAAFDRGFPILRKSGVALALGTVQPDPSGIDGSAVYHTEFMAHVCYLWVHTTGLK